MSAWAIASPLAADANQGQPILEWFWPITQLQNRRLTISVRTCVAAIVVLMTVSAQNPAVHIREASTREKREPALKIATDRNPTQIISLLLVEPGKRTNRDLHRIPALKPSTSPFGVRTPKCRAQSFLVGAARVSSGNEGLGAGRAAGYGEPGRLLSLSRSLGCDPASDGGDYALYVSCCSQHPQITRGFEVKWIVGNTRSYVLQWIDSEVE